MNRSTKKIVTKEELKEIYLGRAARARTEPWTFLKHFTFTKDEHDPTTIAKQFPSKAMYRIIARIWNEHDVIFIEKSRQIMMTWIMAALFLWDFLFKKARRIALQSKKQEDADAVLERQRHIYEQLVALKLYSFFEETGGFPWIKQNGTRFGNTSGMKIEKSKSDVQAIPQGPDILRSYTFSGIFSDEINHQGDVDESYAASMPTISGGGKWVGQGTANGKQFAYYRMNGFDENTRKFAGKHKLDSNNITDKMFVPPSHLSDEEQRYWIEDKILSLSEEEFNAIPIDEIVACMPGMRFWINYAGDACVRVHYTADPDKDPITAKGKIWYQAERPKYSISKWEREFEIRYDTFEGRPVIQNWDRDLFVKRLSYDSHHPIRLSMDFGTGTCGCLFGQYVPIDGFNARQLKLIDEVKLDMSNTPELADAILDLLKSKYLRAWNNNHILAYCDPAGNQSRETTSDKSLNTSIKILNAKGIYPNSQQFGVPETTELLETVFALTLPNGEPAVVIDENLKYFIDCFGGGLHYPIKGGRPGYYEKDEVWDHGGDMGRYMFANCFDQYAVAQVELPKKRKSTLKRRNGQIIGRLRRTSVNRGRH